MRKLLVLCLVLGSFACPATVGTYGAIYVPRDAAVTCSAHCASIGLPLGSVVIMANSVGCVCNAAPPLAGSPPGALPTADNAQAAASAGGMAALMLEKQRHQSTSSSSTHTY